MTVFLTIVFAILFFALIMASIALHEVGHLVPAKLFGVKVTQYFVGFGKTLWSRTKGGTEYGFKAFPLGGYELRLEGVDRGQGPNYSAETGRFTMLRDGVGIGALRPERRAARPA